MKILMTEPLQPSGLEVFEARDDVELVRPDGTDEASLIAAVEGLAGLSQIDRPATVQ